MAEIRFITEQGFPSQWVAELGLGPSPHVYNDWSSVVARDRVTIRYGPYVGVFTRGMLTELTLSLGEWYGLAEQFLSRWPLEQIEIIDVPGLFFEIEQDGEAWGLVAGFETVDSERDDLETYPNFWSMSTHYDDRAALVKWIARDSRVMIERLNAMQQDP